MATRGSCNRTANPMEYWLPLHNFETFTGFKCLCLHVPRESMCVVDYEFRKYREFRDNLYYPFVEPDDFIANIANGVHGCLMWAYTGNLFQDHSSTKKKFNC
eukprot:Gregarina_sp_Poly_1__4086@NODE_2241_length_2420_cov_50_401190_g1439_i0_p3_GENE_NODE_2241_length_2420_cov_50_401190_g1439_i0NODE_2241_length_2420_cov_50_401190_g1439_i0_p3_ORF_typecomplete_len102_score2_60_NODE_2241_length_2420_cov_50_401190_g1439_i08761181